MNINFNRNSFLKRVFHFLVMAFIAKAISLVGWFFLPTQSVQNTSKSQFVMPYMRYSILDFRLTSTKLEVNEAVSSLSINSIILKAIYKMGKESIIVLAPKSNPKKSKTIAIGEKFEGYKLEKVFSDYVLFTKNYKQYRLYLNLKKGAPRWKNVDKTASTEGEVRRIAKAEVKRAMANPTNIWKNIGLREHFTAGKQDGFKVSFVRKGTVFESLGLRVGDVIEAINNQEIKNNAQAFKAYQQFKDAKALKLNIKRGNTAMELEYEIY
jgi:general secretion pathway protein C